MDFMGGLEADIILLVKEIKNKYYKIKKLEISLMKKENVNSIEIKFYDDKNNQLFYKQILTTHEAYENFITKLEEKLKNNNIPFEVIEEKSDRRKRAYIL